MGLLKRSYTILIVFVVVMFLNPVFAQETTEDEPCIKTQRNGTPIYDERQIDSNELKKIIENHEKWVESDGKKGERANLSGAIYQKSSYALYYAQLQKAIMNNVNLQGTILQLINLQGADLWGAELQGATLEDVNLQGAELDHACLQGATLDNVNLQEAILKGVNLQGAILKDVDLGGAVFEIKPNSLPNIPSIAKARNLSLLKYEYSSHALIELREAFKKSGFRKQEREVTHAIMSSRRENALENGSKWERIIAFLALLFLEWTCEWGMEPLRPLFILSGFIIFFTCIYGYTISSAGYSKKKTYGIWKIWLHGRIGKDTGKKTPEELLEIIFPKCFVYGFYFSFLSAFKLGWGNINVGKVFARINFLEFTLKATGWRIKIVSAFQSLISLYLQALSFWYLSTEYILR